MFTHLHSSVGGDNLSFQLEVREKPSGPPVEGLLTWGYVIVDILLLSVMP